MSTKDNKKVAVVILNWNRKDKVLDCVHHIYKLDYPVEKIIVVDNASTDGSVEAIREKYPVLPIVAFKAEFDKGSDELIKIAKNKLISENLNLIIANDVSSNPMGGGDNQVNIINDKSTIASSDIASKREIANIIWDNVEKEISM